MIPPGGIRRRRSDWLLGLACVVAWSGGGPAPGPAQAFTDPAGAIGGTRPVVVHVPPGYTPGSPMPLIVALHGYGSSSAFVDAYFRLTQRSDQRGFLLVHPEGTVDRRGHRFWNATDACCNLDAAPVDDSTYLSGLITAVAARYTVDPKRVFVVGHSNGGFMAHRLACDHADQIAAIVSLAGAMDADPTKCRPSAPVSVLQIHGTADATIEYAGGTFAAGHAYPGARATAGAWVALDRCAATPAPAAAPLDVDLTLAGAETTVERYTAGCAAGTAVELWTIRGGAHIPALGPAFPDRLIDFLFAHPKP